MLHINCSEYVSWKEKMVLFHKVKSNASSGAQLSPVGCRKTHFTSSRLTISSLEAIRGGLRKTPARPHMVLLAFLVLNFVDSSFFLSFVQLMWRSNCGIHRGSHSCLSSFLLAELLESSGLASSLRAAITSIKTYVQGSSCIPLPQMQDTLVKVSLQPLTSPIKTHLHTRTTVCHLQNLTEKCL